MMKTPSSSFLWPNRLGLTLARASRRPGSRVSAASAFSSALSTSHSRLLQHRSFHAGPYIDAGCQAAQHVIVSIHAFTGLPWALTIPLVAAAVNLLFRLPFSIHSHYILQRRSKIAPVQQAWFIKLWREAVREKVPPNQMKKEVEKRAKSQSKRIYRVLGLQQWKMYGSLLGIPFWLMSLEGIRRLSGWSRWGTQLNETSGVIGEAKTAVNAENGAALATPSAGHEGPVSVQLDLASTPVETTAVTTADISSSAANISAATPSLDPTLANEGMLWFTDLTAADPYYVLPVCFAALTVLNLMPQDEAARRALFPALSAFLSKKQNTQLQAQQQDTTTPPSTETAQQDDNWRVRLVRIIIVSSPGLVYLTADFPAAMHLYTLTSVLITTGTRTLLSKMAPMAARAKTCKHREMPVIRPPLEKEGEATKMTDKA